MTSTEIRQSFLDFFKEKEHTVVPSASLLPQSPGLLFTNAGMNQFVPYFLGTENAPYSPPRAADTQKCIRAGGKHNDLEDVGYDTYHHTFFEMLGNWSFGDYFKQEAIEWAWELITQVWKFPADRLYATVYAPEEGDPSSFDQEAYDFWKALFEKAGLDPKKHIIDGDVKDNFWMMGETGPCGPCSELHMDITPDKSGAALVNGDSDQCIEIWNLVFIQYNAEADGTFRDLPAKHVDTGMGFERICSIMQNTDGLTNFNKRISNYATDTFSPIFQKLEELSGKKYVDIYPHDPGAKDDMEVLEQAIAFRVIADHLRTLSLSIADGIQPGNNGRNYVLRRIMRRAVRYGRALGFSGETLFMGQLVDTLADQLTIFPELGEKREMVKETLNREEKSFNEKLDRGLKLFGETQSELISEAFKNITSELSTLNENLTSEFKDQLEDVVKPFQKQVQESVKPFKDQLKETLKPMVESLKEVVKAEREELESKIKQKAETIKFPAERAFKLYDTFGFPLDLTALLCREKGLDLNENEVEEHMEAQRARARAAQKSEIVRAVDISTDAVTAFQGFDQTDLKSTVLEVIQQEEGDFIITAETPFYVEKGGQVGDTGTLNGLPVISVTQVGDAIIHILSKDCGIQVGDEVELSVDSERRMAISSHHTATHILHWALHEHVSKEASQQGSLVTEDRLRFDFSSAALTADQLASLEKAVNDCISQDGVVSWQEVKHADIKGREDIMQFFGDKYGEMVRVVQIGGEAQALNGYSMELCGGTHVTSTADLGQFIIKKEEAIASGVRRIEAVCGEAAVAYVAEQSQALNEEISQAQEKLGSANQKLKQLDLPPVVAQATSGSDLKSLEANLESTKNAAVEAEKAVKKAAVANASKIADALLTEELNKGGNTVLSLEGDPSLLQELLNGFKKRQYAHAAFIIVNDGSKLHLGAYSGETSRESGIMAGKLIQTLGPIAGGKGGGKPDQARGAAPELDKAGELEAKAREELV